MDDFNFLFIFIYFIFYFWAQYKSEPRDQAWIGEKIYSSSIPGQLF